MNRWLAIALLMCLLMTGCNQPSEPALAPTEPEAPIEQPAPVKEPSQPKPPSPPEEPSDELGGELPEPPSPAVAILIDDMGYWTDGARLLVDIPYPITIAIMPNTPFIDEQSQTFRDRGHQVLVHVPMEPLPQTRSDGSEYTPYAGAGTISPDMDEEEVYRLVCEHIDAIPRAIGLNNHMGSRATADLDIMRVVATAAKERGLFLVDSMTTASSRAREAAKLEEVPFVANTLFLDNVREVDEIKARIFQLGRLAAERGFALGIGHPHVETVTALIKALPELEQDGIMIVLLSQYVTVPGDADE